jgi:hypothetical protein
LTRSIWAGTTVSRGPICARGDGQSGERDAQFQ